ncbi:GNAT family N-acetyltransferase [Oricola sp.]|uniref:GNAT family N-acetyltransferase n=1 Tax=Oricola sp. TaxID=1979950 RepID=UPI0025FD27F9|nr:GNAT family N-acetyltransferase [Oricola sp.]MCI5076246.1 GNAT family N-acetyltransferase [Oricola sp.]
MGSIEITVLDGASEDLDDALVDLLETHSKEAGSPFVETDVAIRATRDGKLLGGLSGKAHLGWLNVRMLATAPDARGSGVGAELMQRGEEVARKMGLAGIYLDTYDFQAPGFYEKIGYTELGRLPAAGGHPRRIWFQKLLARPA